jgi:hypothetical protein
MKRRNFLRGAASVTAASAMLSIMPSCAQSGPGQLTFFSKSQLDSVRRKPEDIVPLYAALKVPFRNKLGGFFDAEFEEHIEAAFCGVMAYEMAPYGASAAKELNDLFAEKQLDCDNYCALAWALFEVLRPSPTTSLAVVGWDGGAIGNHAQIFVQHPSLGYGLIDPTFGFYQCGVNFDAIASGKPAAPDFRKSFYLPAPATDAMYATVIKALDEGLYKPSDLLYYTKYRDKLVKMPAAPYWMTPRAERKAR